jgi:hypothetical protein
VKTAGAKQHQQITGIDSRGCEATGTSRAPPPPPMKSSKRQDEPSRRAPAALQTGHGSAISAIGGGLGVKDLRTLLPVISLDRLHRNHRSSYASGPSSPLTEQCRRGGVLGNESSASSIPRRRR